MDLSGEWRAAPADDELRRAFPEPGMDDGAWPRTEVPSHWRSQDCFADHDGPILYRCHFEHPRPLDGKRAWLVFDGVFYQSDVWLDGAYLGDTEGYFVPHAFEVTHLLQDRSSHVLGVEVACSASRARNLTGLHQTEDWNPGGIWRPVRLVETGPVRVERLRVLCTDASEERAVIAMRAVLDCREPRRVRIRTTVGGHGDGTEHEQEQRLAAGANRVEWRMRIERPTLWWPRTLGAPALCDLAVDVMDADSGELSDGRTVRTGVREVRQRSFLFDFNGQRLFLKGANVDPLTRDLARADPCESSAMVGTAAALGLDFLRLRGHITVPEFYAAADVAGLLVWQDLPLHGTYARSVRRQATRQAREAVDLLGHHPSVFHWTAHNEPVVATGRARRFFAQELPTWNKTVLDLSIHRALTRSDPSRPITAHSGVDPGPFSPGTDTHLRGQDVAAPLARFPRRARFVSEFGDAASAESDVEATVLRRQIEHLRLLKYRPTGGFAFLSLNKLAVGSHASVAAGLAPTIVVAEGLPQSVSAGETYAVDVHVAHDGRYALESAVLHARLQWPGGHRDWMWRGSVPADSCVRVATLSIVVPSPDATSDGCPALELELELRPPGREPLHNTYRSPYRSIEPGT